MARSSSRLDVVLRIAALREQQAKIALAEALNSFHAKDQEVRMISDAILASKEMGASSTSMGWWGLSEDLLNHRGEREEQRVVLQAEYLERANAYIDALNSEKMLRKVSQRKRTALRYDAERRDLNEMLELSLSVRATWEAHSGVN